MAQKPEDVVRVIRIIEYVGPRDWMEKQLAQNSIKIIMTGYTKEGDAWSIREATLNQFPEVIKPKDIDNEQA